MTDLTWVNKLQMVTAECNLWKKIAIFAFASVGILSITLGFMAYHYFSKINTQRLLLVAPTLGVGPVNVEADAVISDNIIKVIAKRVVELNEIWTYESIKDNFDELFKYYYDTEVVEITKNNLKSTNRYEYVMQNKIISTFKINWDKSEFSWCGKLQRACSLVVGQRKIYLNNNEPYKEVDVAYLIFTHAIFPTQENPHAVRVKRIKIDDTSESPYKNLFNQYNAALKGELIDENK